MARVGETTPLLTPHQQRTRRCCVVSHVATAVLGFGGMIYAGSQDKNGLALTCAFMTIVTGVFIYAIYRRQMER